MRRVVLLLSAAILAGCSANEDKTRETKITWEQTPIAVRQGIEKSYPDAKVQSVVREDYVDTGMVHYEVELTTKHGEKKEAEFTPDGEMLSEEE